MGQLATSSLSQRPHLRGAAGPAEGGLSHDAVVGWFHDHPDAVRGDADRLVSRAEAAVRQHVWEDAWREARDYIEQRMHEYERSWGFHASDAYVALEVCPKLARSLRTHERHVEPGDEAHLVGERLLSMFDEEGKRLLGEWALQLGEQEHHKVWEDIIRHTRKRGRELVRAGRLSSDLDWETTANFAAKAAMIAALLVAEYDARAHLRRARFAD